MFSVLMDIREELQELNRVFACGRFQAIPTRLEEIALDARRRTRLVKQRAAAKRKATAGQ